MDSSSRNAFTWLAHPAVLYGDSHFSVWFVVFSILHLCVCFILLGICSSDYLCPNVSNITSKHGNRSHRGILTAIVLSWCNSSPDLFSNFISWTSSDAAGLSVGEVLGSCGAILCVVQGAIFISMSSTALNIELYQCHNVLRDLSFILMSMIMLFYVCLRNEVTLLNCVLMMVLYIMYIISKTLIKSSEAGDIYDATSAIPDLWDEPSTGFESVFLPEAESGIKPSLLTSMDYTNLLLLMESSSTLADDIITMRSLNSDRLDENAISARPYSEPTANVSDLSYRDFPANHSSPSAFNPYHDNEADSGLSQAVLTPQIKYENILQKRFSRLKTGIVFLLVPHLSDFRSKSLNGQVLAVLVTPFAFFFRLTCPQYEDILEINEATQTLKLKRFYLVLLIAQTIFAPFFSLIVLSSLTGFTFRFFYWIIAAGVSVVLLTSVTIFNHKVKAQSLFSLNSSAESRMEEKKTIRKYAELVVNICNFVGILNAILWISVLASQLIEIIELYQRFTGISEAILGLTIFSWGNSISDLMSNVAMCNLYQKLPARNEEQRIQSASNFFFIALGACFGGILLNSLIGVGLSGFTAMLMGASGADLNVWWFQRSVKLGESSVDYKFLISVVSIIIQTIVLIITFSGIPAVLSFSKRNKNNRVGNVFMVGTYYILQRNYRGIYKLLIVLSSNFNTEHLSYSK